MSLSTYPVELYTNGIILRFEITIEFADSKLLEWVSSICSIRNMDTYLVPYYLSQTYQYHYLAQCRVKVSLTLNNTTTSYFTS